MLFNNIPVIIALQFDYSMFEKLMGVAFQSTWVVRSAYALRIEVTTWVGRVVCSLISPYRTVSGSHAHMAVNYRTCDQGPTEYGV